LVAVGGKATSGRVFEYTPEFAAGDAAKVDKERHLEQLGNVWYAYINRRAIAETQIQNTLQSKTTLQRITFVRSMTRAALFPEHRIDRNRFTPSHLISTLIPAISFTEFA
jgi:hypothetical protein